MAKGLERVINLLSVDQSKWTMPSSEDFRKWPDGSNLHNASKCLVRSSGCKSLKVVLFSKQIMVLISVHEISIASLSVEIEVILHPLTPRICKH